MNLVADLLCLLACLTVVTCDRVYVHPFNLFSFNESDCDKLEKLVQEGKTKTIVPVSIESQTTPAYEDDLNDKDKLEAPSLSDWGKEELGYLKDLVYILGMRFYSVLRKAQQGQNVLLSPTSLYSSLVSFYLGASNQTALDLQGLLGLVPPSGNPDCTSRAVGSNFLSNLRTIESLVKSRDEGLLFSKTLCLFSAPGVPLFELFVQDLLHSADAFYARAVDFTNPSEAAKQINAFVEAKSEGQSKCLLTAIDPSADLLFAVDVRLAASVQQAFMLKEPQEFWVDSNTNVLVPMLSITGTFKHKTDASGTFSVVEVPISKTVLLVLLQPINGSDLEHVESELTWQSSAWLQQLSPREIKLMLPALTIEDSSDLQELLADMGLPALLGKEADFSKISNTNLTVGKVINQVSFKLTSDGTDQAEDPAAQKENGVYLDVTLNKPFLFAVFEKKSRAMLFLGRKYTTSMDFVRKFERQCGSQASVKRLRSHPSYHSFNNKWNLPVYFQIRFREIAGALEEALSDTLEEAPAGSSYCLLATHMVWMSLLKCWSDQMFLPLLAHRLWKLSLQILARYSVFISEVSVRPISNENTKESKKSVPVGRKESSVSLNPSEDQGNGSSPEGLPLSSISSTQLVYVAADLDKLQDQIPDILDMIKPKLEMIGFKNMSCIAGALEDSKASLSACMPTLNNRIIQDLSESSFAYLKSALEVPRLYRRTNKEVPTKASPYVDSALKPFYRLQNEYKDTLKQPVVHQWLEGALSESTQKYYETVSDVLSSVKKMEESLKRLKQARRTATSNPVGTNGGMSDDNKIRLQLALDVEYFGEQIRKMGLETSSIKSFSALTELVLTAKDQATAEQS